VQPGLNKIGDHLMVAGAVTFAFTNSRRSSGTTMQVYLQRGVNGDFFQSPGHWTPFQTHGLDFATMQSAIDFARATQMTDVQIVVLFANGVQKFVLPLQEQIN
jgi:hypothetical protein